jgi:hypothetical protein
MCMMHGAQKRLCSTEGKCAQSTNTFIPSQVGAFQARRARARKTLGIPPASWPTKMPKCPEFRGIDDQDVTLLASLRPCPSILTPPALLNDCRPGPWPLRGRATSTCTHPRLSPSVSAAMWSGLLACWGTQTPFPHALHSAVLARPSRTTLICRQCAESATSKQHYQRPLCTPSLAPGLDDNSSLSVSELSHGTHRDREGNQQ